MKASFQRISLLVLAAVVFFGESGLAQAEVHFKNVTFAEAKKLAAKEKKTVMVDFYTDWCVWCKVLDQKTYSDANVGTIADSKFIAVKINAEKGEGIELAKQSQITGYPTIVFFSPDGKEVDRVVGYQDADRFARSLTLAASGGVKAVLDEVSSKKGSNDPAKWLTAADYYTEQKQNDKALAAFQKVTELDPEDKLQMKEQAEYGVAFLTPGDSRWALLERAVLNYPKRDEGQQAVMLLIKHDIDMQSNDQALRIMETWAAQHPEDQNTFNFVAWTAAEKGVLLSQSEQYADRAVQLSKDPAEKAGAIDTYAEVLFKENRPSEALAKEQEAIAMLNPEKDKRLLKELTMQKQKFEEAVNAGPASGSNPTSTAAH